MTEKIQCEVFIACSADGFIARTDGDVAWLDNPGYALEGEDFGYYALMDRVDALVMGRNTYDVVRGLGVAWPYGDKAVRVLTHRDIDIPADLAGRVTAMSGTPDEIVEQLAQSGFQRVYIDGGAVIQDFLRAGLISRMIITTIPVLLGSGIRLFGAVEQDVHLKPVAVQHWPNGFVQTEWGFV